MTTTRLNVLLFSILLTASCSKSRTAAPVKPQLEKVSFRKVLILGNSITRHPKVPAIGWNAEWGMAASSPDKDYVHLLEANFKKSDASTKVTAVNISAFEHNFGSII